jgi:hypothetical protein
MRAQLPLRLTRSAAFSVVCVGLAALGHNLAGGAGPAPWAMLAGGTAIMLVTSALAGRERPAVAIAVCLVVTQVALHELFAVEDPSGVSLALHAHGAAGLGESAGMLTAHLTATLLTAWWLARGEATLWTLLRHLAVTAAHRLDALLSVATGLPAAPEIPAPRPVGSPPALPARRLLRHTVTRRGPPLRAA